MPETIQEKVQFGIETTKGTPVAATRIGYGVLSPPNIARTLNYSQTRTGSYLARRKGSYSRISPSFSWSEACTYEDLAWWGQLTIDGAVTPVSDAETPPGYTYTYDPDLATDTLKSVTMEFGSTGQVSDAPQTMATSMTLRIAPDSESAMMMDVELLSQDITPGTAYASLSERATEEIMAAGFLFYIDDASDDLGTTLKSGMLIDASLTFTINRHFKAFVENVRGSAPNKVGRGERTLDAQFTFEFDSLTEYTNFLSDTPVLRAVRLVREGSEISTGVNKSVIIDIVGYWSTWAGSDRKGNRTATMTLAAGYDVDFANDFQMVIVNDLAVLA